MNTRDCLECGSTFEAVRRWRNHWRVDHDRQFCSRPCKTAFQNRMSVRGAQLYPLFMAMRYERDAAAQAGLWRDMCRLAEGFREQDKAERQGRKSWLPFRRVVDRLRDAGLISRQITASEAREWADREREAFARTPSDHPSPPL